MANPSKTVEVLEPLKVTMCRILSSVVYKSPISPLRIEMFILKLRLIKSSSVPKIHHKQ